MPYFLVISGSLTKFSKTAFLLRTTATHLEAHGLELRAVHVADVERSFTNHLIQLYLGGFDQLVQQSEAIILLTPVAKASDQSLLAPLLDLLPDGAFANKPVLLVATGGLSEHASELERTSTAEFRRLRVDLLKPSIHIGWRDWIIVGDNPPKLTRRTEDRLADALREAQTLAQGQLTACEV